VQHNPLDPGELDPEIFTFYREAMTLLVGEGIPFLVGGAYALNHYTGVTRHTKDFDIFITPPDVPTALQAFAARGYRTEMTFPHWLGKVFSQDAFIDLICSSGNGLCTVDWGWFEHAAEADVLGFTAKITPAEEMIWSKGFVMERERFDGADIAHLLRARAPRLDWDRLLRRFGPHWRLLLCHLILFGFVYPAERAAIPDRVWDRLLLRLQKERTSPAPAGRVCQGTLLSREQYLIDLELHGYQDARLLPPGSLSPEDVAQWTEAISQG
jgi:hypothetical protein